MIILDSDLIIALALKETESINISQLFVIRNCFIKQYPEIVIDLSSASINAAVRNYPEIFKLKDDVLSRSRKALSYLNSNYINIFSLGLSLKVRQKLIETVHKVLSKVEI